MQKDESRPFRISFRVVIVKAIKIEHTFTA